jgi:hypothetical protein
MEVFWLLSDELDLVKESSPLMGYILTIKEKIHQMPLISFPDRPSGSRAWAVQELTVPRFSP